MTLCYGISQNGIIYVRVLPCWYTVMPPMNGTTRWAILTYKFDVQIQDEGKEVYL